MTVPSASRSPEPPPSPEFAGLAGGGPGRGGRVLQAVVWLPGVAVALGAAVATAHGLYEVATAAGVPVVIAGLYPLITDGLALVAYAATARLRTPPARRYAWAVVVLAAGLSGLAQASYLAAGATLDTGAGLRFGVGAWPALAAAIVAHLLYLLATDHPDHPDGADSARPASATGSIDTTRSTTAELYNPVFNQVYNPARAAPLPAAQPGTAAVPGDPLEHRFVHREHPVQHPLVHPGTAVQPDPPAESEEPDSAPRDRARAAAAQHADDHGALPTVSELEALAGVSRGTAAAVLRTLRHHPPPLHLITSEQQDDPARPDARTQP